MRWNCPHCASTLAVADEKIGSSWSFSRCYKCGGFALVRRSDLNLIKVDRAPPGEPVLLPEANEDPLAVLSKTATENLARYTGTAAPSIQVSKAENEKPVIRPAVRAASRAEARVENRPEPRIEMKPEVPVSIEAPFSLPDPLPDEPRRSFGQKMVPAALAMAGLFTISTGIYLYIQGQALWEKARLQATESAAAAAVTTSEAEPDANTPISAPPSTGNEIVQAPSIAPDVPTQDAPKDAAQKLPRFASTSGSANIGRPARSEVIDEVHANAMAPSREITPAETKPEPKPEPARRQIQVEVLADNTHLHSGPGMKYPVVGAARNQRKYAVEEWRDRWFKINLENPAAKEPAHQPSGAPRPKKTAWIRNDLVRLAP